MWDNKFPVLFNLVWAGFSVICSKEGRKKGMKTVLVGDKLENLKHSEKLLAIFKMEYFNHCFSELFRQGQIQYGILYFLLPCICSFLFRLCSTDIFSPEVLSYPVSTEESDNLKMHKIVTVMLFIIFNSQILLTWLQTQRGRTCLVRISPMRLNMMPWYHRSSETSAEWESFVFFP